MAKDANEKAVKSRQTKLSKKTAEELIQIILRKDKVEKNLNSQVTNLNSQVTNLKAEVNSLKKDHEGFKDSILFWNNKYNDLLERSRKERGEVERECRHTIAKVNKDKIIWQAIAIVIAFAFVIACIV